jgi:multidrug efflux pump subunit AcrA (membrane-fusion protein)
MKFSKKLLIIAPVICGIILFAVMKINKKAPVRLENRERVQAVRVIPLEKMAIVPRIISYGYVEADRTWKAIPEVSGEIVSVNANLKKGYFIKKDEVLFKIDTTSYGLAKSRGVADLMNVDARLRELDQSRKNTERLLAIEKKSLASASQELKRKHGLLTNGYISVSDLEKEERIFLGHQTTVKNLMNKLDLIPSQKKALLAQKKSGESTVTQRKLDIAKTEIRAPFDCRLVNVNIELYQFAAAGTVLAEAESIDRAEIPVSLTPKSLLTLLPREYGDNIVQMLDMETVRRAIGITAKVRLPMDDELQIEWDGSFSRTSESLDPKTGALTIYITVDNPYDNVIPGKRPPLITNMYVEVELKGRLLQDRFIVPRSTIHDSKVYICTPENRLKIKSVDVEFYMGDVAVLSEGLQQGENLVLTDLVPAIEGMLLKPVQAKDVLEHVKQQALGEAN